jgi:hypothetical protein
MSDVVLAVTDSTTVQFTLQTPGVQGPSGASEFFDVAGTTHTLQEANRSKIGRFTSSSAVTITVPAGLSSVYDCMIVQVGTGQITVQAGAGVTLRSGGSAFKSAYRYAVINIICIGANEFIVTGEVTT